MTEANGEFVKVYLYLVRLLNNNSEVTVAGIADHFNLTENDICRAIKYWISRDVLKLSYDGKGRLNGIVLLPLHAPMLDMKMDTDAVSILNAASDTDDEDDMASKENRPVLHAVPVASSNTQSEFAAPSKPNYSKQQLVAAFEDNDLADIQYLIETLFKRPITPTNNATILYIYDTLGFSVDLFEYLVEYCVEMDKKNFRYMEAVAIAWYKDGIKTRNEAKEQSVIAKGISSVVFKALGIRRQMPTDAEMAFINTWSKDYGFSNDIIKKACDKAILAQPGSANFAYVNAILENWHKNNVKTMDDIDRLDKAFIAKSATNNLKANSNVSSFNNFKQTKMDSQLEEMEQLFLREVNN